MDSNLPAAPASTLHDVMNDSAVRDLWKGTKGAGVILFGKFAAPAIAASLGVPPVAILSFVGFGAHALLSFLGRKFDIDWL